MMQLNILNDLWVPCCYDEPFLVQNQSRSMGFKWICWLLLSSYVLNWILTKNFTSYWCKISQLIQINLMLQRVEQKQLKDGKCLSNEEHRLKRFTWPTWSYFQSYLTYPESSTYLCLQVDDRCGSQREQRQHSLSPRKSLCELVPRFW